MFSDSVNCRLTHSSTQPLLHHDNYFGFINALGMSLSIPISEFKGKSKEQKKGKRKLVTKKICSIPLPSSEPVTVLWPNHSMPKRLFKVSEALNSQETACGKRKSVFYQAEELQSRLDPKHPSFIKSLLKSHVTGGFWMGLPVKFCQKHLPQKDTFITLETQSKKQFKAKYLPRKTGLSGGWKGFAISEKLLVGDVVVFHLVSTAKFKVYTIKANNLTEEDGALSLLIMDNRGEQSGPETSKGEDIQRTMHPPVKLESSSTENSSRRDDGFQLCEAAALTSNSTVSTFDNFSVVISNLLKDFELPREMKWRYYNLCCSQNASLHDHLPKWMNHILVGGIIIETVNIADALRQCKISTFKEKSVNWEKTLKALELLGMNIGFLRAHLVRLQKIVHDPKVDTFRQKCLELCSENTRTEDEIKCLEDKLVEIKTIHNKRYAAIKILKLKIQNHEREFQEQVHASCPW